MSTIGEMRIYVIKISTNRFLQYYYIPISTQLKIKQLSNPNNTLQYITTN